MINPISVDRCVSDVRTRLIVPASSPSGSSGEAGRVLSMMAKAKDVRFEKARSWVCVGVWNSEAKLSWLGQGPMGMWVYSSGCDEERRKKVVVWWVGLKGVSLRRVLVMGWMGKRKVDGSVMLFVDRRFLLSMVVDV